MSSNFWVKLQYFNTKDDSVDLKHTKDGAKENCKDEAKDNLKEKAKENLKEKAKMFNISETESWVNNIQVFIFYLQIYFTK